MSEGSAKEAAYWSAEENNAVRCGLCPHRCHVPENSTGACGVRENRVGRLIASSYGQVSSVALDPIEKKPLYMFHPGKRILSIGGFGCNMKCRFCQNYEISSEYGKIRQNASRLSPDDVVSAALRTVPEGNVGIAYTYNEPLVGYEFVADCAVLAFEKGLYNVLVTNGCINAEPLENLLPLVDAMNIDLKGFTDGFYKYLGGDLETVKETIARASAVCHVEVTTLVLPGVGDPDSRADPSTQGNENDIPEIAKWLASVDPGIPLHLTRFFPKYHYRDRQPTPRETILRLCEAAKKHLKYVFPGNMG